jgi:hypothetical protein
LFFHENLPIKKCTARIRRKKMGDMKIGGGPPAGPFPLGIGGEKEDFAKEIYKKVLTILQDQQTHDKSGKDGPGPKIMEPSSGLDVAEMLTSLKGKISEDMQKVCKSSIETNRADQKKKADERVKKLMEAVNAMKTANTWGTIGTVLGYVSSIGSMLLGAALIGVGVLTAILGGSGVAVALVGASLVAGGVVGLTATILSHTGAADDIMDWMAAGFEKMGFSEEAAKWIAFGIYTATFMVAQLAASLISVANLIPGAVKATVDATVQAVKAGVTATIKTVIKAVMKMIKEAINSIMEAFKSATQTSLKVAVKTTAKMFIENLGTALKNMGPAALEGVVSVAKSGVDFEKALATMDAQNKKADAIDINALLKKLQQKLEEQAQWLQEVMESSQKGVEIVMGVIDSTTQATRMTLQV